MLLGVVAFYFNATLKHHVNDFSLTLKSLYIFKLVAHVMIANETISNFHVIYLSLMRLEYLMYLQESLLEELQLQRQKRECNMSKQKILSITSVS